MKLRPARKRGTHTAEKLLLPGSALAPLLALWANWIAEVDRGGFRWSPHPRGAVCPEPFPSWRAAAQLVSPRWRY